MSAPSSTSDHGQTPRDGRDVRWAAHRVARRRELVDATVRAIRTHGAGVGMEEIAAQAGTSKTVIYRHLGDRHGVYLAVCESVDARILAEIEQATASSGGFATTAEVNLPRILGAVIDSYLRLVERDPEVYRFVVRRPDVTLPDDLPASDPVTGLSGSIADNLTHLLAQLQPDDAHTQGRNRALAWALVGMVKESADRWLENPDGLTRTDLARHLAAFAHTGLAGHGELPTSDGSAPHPRRR